MKKLLIVLAIASLLLFLFGCSSNSVQKGIVTKPMVDTKTEYKIG